MLAFLASAGHNRIKSLFPNPLICNVLAGYLLSVVENNWSLFIVIIGFFTGCLAGVEYEESKSL